MHANTRIHFASVEEATDVLGQSDAFMQAMGPLERQLRLAADTPVTPQAYLKFVREQALAWEPSEVQQFERVIQHLRPKLAEFDNLWPPVITLIKTTGREEANAPHCRGNAIVLPALTVAKQAEALKALMLHELFHILSRQSPARREQLYQILGFRYVEPIDLPQVWQDRRITNPDAPRVDCIIPLEHEHKVQTYAPVLLTRADAYDHVSDHTLFGELLFRLMPVELGEKGWIPTPAAQAGELRPADELPDYAQHIGRNTRYIIHPDEILADNFVHLVLQTAELPDPEIVRRLGEALGVDDR